MSDEGEFLPDELRQAWIDHPERFNVISKSPTDEEEDVLEKARELANAKKAFSTDVLRLIASGKRSYDAQHAAEIGLGRDVAEAEARYQIALARLRA